MAARPRCVRGSPFGPALWRFAPVAGPPFVPCQQRGAPRRHRPRRAAPRRLRFAQIPPREKKNRMAKRQRVAIGPPRDARRAVKYYGSSSAIPQARKSLAISALRALVRSASPPGTAAWVARSRSVPPPAPGFGGLCPRAGLRPAPVPSARLPRSRGPVRVRRSPFGPALWRSAPVAGPSFVRRPLPVPPVPAFGLRPLSGPWAGRLCLGAFPPKKSAFSLGHVAGNS